MSLDDHSCVPFYRLKHPLPHGLRKTAHNGIVMGQQAPGPFIMIPHEKNGGPQGRQKPPPFVDIIKIIVCCIGVAIVVQSACAKRRKIIRIPKVNHFIRLKLLPEQQNGSQRVTVGPVAMGATDSHYTFPRWNNRHG